MVNSRFPLKKCHEILISTDKYCLQCRFDELNIAMFSYFKKDRELTSDITIPGTASTSGQYSLTGNTWNVTTFVIWMYCTWNIIHLKLNWNYFYRSSKIISKILNSTRLKKIKLHIWFNIHFIIFLEQLCVIFHHSIDYHAVTKEILLWTIFYTYWFQATGPRTRQGCYKLF